MAGYRVEALIGRGGMGAVYRAKLTLIGVGDAPVDVAVGEGAVWVANSLAGSVSRIDPDTNEVVATIEVGGRPQRIAAGEGAVWVTAGASN